MTTQNPNPFDSGGSEEVRFSPSRRIAGTTWGDVMPGDLSLGDAVRQLALLMTEKGLALPFKNEEPWHLLFYRLKDETKGKTQPEFLTKLRFDSDNRYPRCRQLSEFLHGLHTTCTAGVPNPSYEELILEGKMTALWQESGKSLEKSAVEFLNRALEIATEEFPRRNAERLPEA